jgi:hypothetical protein
MTRQIAHGVTFRLGPNTYAPGDEARLYEDIDAHSAQQHVAAGRLQGDWSGAQGKHAERVATKHRKHDETLLHRPELLGLLFPGR